jgi:hypothetical protein
VIADDAPDLKARLTEVEQQAQVQSGRPRVIQALRQVDIIERLDSLVFHKNLPLDQQMNRVFTHHDTVVGNNNPRCCATTRPALRNSCASAFSYTFSRNPDPSVLATANAPLRICSDRAFNPSAFIRSLPRT